MSDDKIEDFAWQGHQSVSVRSVPTKGNPKLVVRVSADQLTALDERCKAEGVTRSDVVREALGAYLRADDERD